MKYIIISRHPAAVEFIRASHPKFSDAPVITGNATPEDVRGKFVAGNIPLHLAAVAEAVFAIEFEGAPPRGQEYGIEDMVSAGARLVKYIVRGA